MTKEESVGKAVDLFDSGYACSQSVLLAFAGRYNLDEDTAKRIASTFGGGMGRLRQKCGALTGGFMVLGLEFGNSNPKDMETKLKAYQKVRELDSLVKDTFGSSECLELLKRYSTEKEIEGRKHHKVICRKVVAEVTCIVSDMIQKK